MMMGRRNTSVPETIRELVLGAAEPMIRTGWKGLEGRAIGVGRETRVVGASMVCRNDAAGCYAVAAS